MVRKIKILHGLKKLLFLILSGVRFELDHIVKGTT